MVAGPKFWATVPHFRDHFCLHILFEDGSIYSARQHFEQITYVPDFNTNQVAVPVSYKATPATPMG